MARSLGLLAGSAAILSIAVLLALGAATPTAATAAPAAPAAEPGTFKIDAVHSSVIFKIKHMDAANFYGAFKDVSGTFSTGDKASCNVTVKAESVDTRNEGRDKHVKSPDFFSAKEFPTITFVAKDLAKSDDGWKGKGDLTFRGQTKPVDVTVSHTGDASGRDGKPIAGVEATFTMKRSDFGNKVAPGLSDEVTLIVALEGALTSESK